MALPRLGAVLGEPGLTETGPSWGEDRTGLGPDHANCLLLTAALPLPVFLHLSPRDPLNAPTPRLKTLPRLPVTTAYRTVQTLRHSGLPGPHAGPSPPSRSAPFPAPWDLRHQTARFSLSERCLAGISFSLFHRYALPPQTGLQGLLPPLLCISLSASPVLAVDWMPSNCQNKSSSQRGAKGGFRTTDLPDPLLRT